MPFTFKRLSIPDAVLIEAKAFEDARGYFAEIFKKSDFTSFGIENSIVQENLSHSKRGVLRGLHYQLKPAEQAKLVTVVKGEIYDVAVDIRRNSKYYGKYVAEYLSHKNLKMLFVPEGFAHGFCVLSDEADVVYGVTKEYSAINEKGIAWNDPSLAIKWPIDNPILSEKDAKLPTLDKAENNF